MIDYSKVEPTDCENLECLTKVNNLFALFDTPANVIFIDQFNSNLKEFKDIFKQYFMPENIFFSCKCNKSHALLEYSARQNCGVEVSSNYELIDALKHTKKIIATGPAKDDTYLENSINNKVIISVDDIEELKNILKFNKETKVLLRLSNLLNIVSRFGININQIDECLKLIENSNVKFLGFSFHINNYSLDDRVNAIKQIISIIKKKNLKIKYIDIGGGLPSNYCSKQDYENFIKNNNENMYFKKHFIDDYYPYYSDIANADALNYILKNTCEELKQNNIELVVEPGRSLLSNVGVSIYEVQYLKKLYNGDNLIVTNGNINCLSEQWFNSDYLLEPKLYIPDKTRKKERIYASICGNLCLEQDMLTWRRIKFDYIPKKGDLLVYYNTAGYQMDSNESEFHKIPLVKKIIVRKDNLRYIIEEDEIYDS